MYGVQPSILGRPKSHFSSQAKGIADMSVSIVLNAKEIVFLTSTFGHDTNPFDQVSAGLNNLTDNQVYEISERLLALSDTEFDADWNKTDRGQLIDRLIDKFHVE